MTQKTIYSAHGWLPYGVTDDSILLQVDMTSEAEMTAISASASAELTATPGFDSVKGMICSGSSAGWLITKLTGYADLDNEGQITFEVETSFLASGLGTSTADSTVQTSDPTPLTIRDTGNNWGTFTVNNVAGNVAKAYSLSFDGLLDVTRNQQFDAAVNSTTPTNAPQYIHSYGKGEFTTINIGWRGSEHWLAVNGKMIMRETFTPHANMFDRIYLGSYIGSGNYKVGSWYIRRFQVSNRAPTFPVHPQLRRVITWSDSLFESADSYAVTTNEIAMDNTVNAQIRQELGNRGIYCGWLDSDVNDGMTIYKGTQASTVLSTITAQRPEIVVMQFGTNDVTAGAAFSGTDFLDTATHGYKALVDALDAAGVQHIIVCTVPPQNNVSGVTQAVLDAVDDANTAIKTLPAYNTKVTVADVFTAMGGSSSSSTLYQSDGLHMDGSGMYLHGQEVARAILSVLGR